MIKNFSLEQHLKLTKFKLKEAKQKIKLFALDYDGTIYDGLNYKQEQVLSLLEKILLKDKLVALITARAATALKIIAPQLQELLFTKKIEKPVFIAGGNGTILHRLEKDKLIEIYNYGLNIEQINKAVEGWEKVYKKFKIERKDLSERGLETFQKFLKDNWENYIPKEILKFSFPFEGKIFTEKAKVSFVLPKDKLLHQRLIKEIQKELGDNFNVLAGDETFCHITKKLKEDSKALAIKTILKFLDLKEEEVAAFGDMPNDNDRGLSNFPYSFTNSEEFVKFKKTLDQPPYILPGVKLTPVAKIYKAIDYLLF